MIAAAHRPSFICVPTEDARRLAALAELARPAKPAGRPWGSGAARPCHEAAAGRGAPGPGMRAERGRSSTARASSSWAAADQLRSGRAGSRLLAAGLTEILRLRATQGAASSCRSPLDLEPWPGPPRMASSTAQRLRSPASGRAGAERRRSAPAGSRRLQPPSRSRRAARGTSARARGRAATPALHLARAQDRIDRPGGEAADIARMARRRARCGASARARYRGPGRGGPSNRRLVLARPAAEAGEACRAQRHVAPIAGLGRREIGAGPLAPPRVLTPGRCEPATPVRPGFFREIPGLAVGSPRPGPVICPRDPRPNRWEGLSAPSLPACPPRHHQEPREAIGRRSASSSATAMSGRPTARRTATTTSKRSEIPVPAIPQRLSRRAGLASPAATPVAQANPGGPRSAGPARPAGTFALAHRAEVQRSSPGSTARQPDAGSTIPPAARATPRDQDHPVGAPRISPSAAPPRSPVRRVGRHGPSRDDRLPLPAQARIGAGREGEQRAAAAFLKSAGAGPPCTRRCPGRAAGGRPRATSRDHATAGGSRRRLGDVRR
jgi:hypothetical protein